MDSSVTDVLQKKKESSVTTIDSERKWSTARVGVEGHDGPISGGADHHPSKRGCGEHGQVVAQQHGFG